MKKTKIILLVGILTFLMLVSTASAETWTFDSDLQGWTPLKEGCGLPLPFWVSGYGPTPGVIMMNACVDPSHNCFTQISKSVYIPNSPSKIKVHVYTAPTTVNDGGFQLKIEDERIGREYIDAHYDKILEYSIPESYQGSSHTIYVQSISSYFYDLSNGCDHEFIGIDYIEITSTVNAPEFPSIFLPATMIIGFLGAVLLIQRTREH